VNFWPIADILQKKYYCTYGLIIIFGLNDVNGSIIFIVFLLEYWPEVKPYRQSVAR